VALGLEIGEEHAIALALELHAPVLLDEKEARRIAEGKGLIVVGTLGIIERAARKNLVNLKDALGALKRTNFRISEELIEKAIRRNATPGPSL
jgi:predicted nucleic acid-binding protein